MDERIGGKMTREETQELLMMIRAAYPNFIVKQEEMTPTINAWHMLLVEYPADAVKAALQIYVRTSNTGFPPSVSQLIGCIYKPRENDALTEGQAWALVRKAIQDGIYHAEERYKELPEEIQIAVGSPNMIRQWAMVPTEEVNTVIASNFQRTYKAVLSKRVFGDKVNPALAGIVNEVADKVSNQYMIERSKGE